MVGKNGEGLLDRDGNTMSFEKKQLREVADLSENMKNDEIRWTYELNPKKKNKKLYKKTIKRIQDTVRKENNALRMAVAKVNEKQKKRGKKK